MIQGNINVKSEKDYRSVSLDSSSSLKDFSFDKKKYFKKYILGEQEPEDEVDSKASIVGRVVETLLFEPELFDEKFYLSACLKKSTGLMEKFVEAAYQLMRAAAVEDENGELICNKTFKDISQEAFELSGFSGKGTGSYESVINKFAGSDDEIYFNELLQVRFNNMTVITANDVNNAEKIVEELRNNFVTSGIVNLVDNARYTVLKQCKIEGFEIDGHLLKGMLDLCVIDHKEKKIKPSDLKVTWSVENFLSEYYLYRRAYIQAFLYKKAAEKLKKDMNLEDYSVENLNFIVCDSINYYNPLIYTLSDKDMDDAYNGFTYNNKYYPGVKEIILDLNYAMDNNVWNISRKNYETGGIVKLIQ